jgi:hypothetical protein
MNHQQRPVRKNRPDHGTVLVIVIAAVAIASMIVASYLLFIDDHRERSAREDDDAGTKIRLEQSMLRIQTEIQRIAKTQGKVDLPEISPARSSSKASEESLKLTLDGFEEGVAPIESLAAPSSSLTPLENQGDPFLGASAIVLGVEVESSASSLAVMQSRLSSKIVVVNPQIDVRAIPLSEFTVFAIGNGLNIDQTNFAGPIGRIFAARDIQLFGNFSTNYPLVSGGDVDTVGSLTISLGTNSPILFSGEQIAYAQPGDSSQAAWLAKARTQYNSAIVNPGTLPISLTLPPAPNGRVAGPVGNESPGLDLATIRNRCDLLLIVRPSSRRSRRSYRITAAHGNPAWLQSGALPLKLKPVSGGSAALLIPERSGKGTGRQIEPVVARRVGTAGMNGLVVAAFNYEALGQEAQQQIRIIYFEFDSSIADAAVLVRGVGKLQGGLTIASSRPVLIAGDFNVGPNPAAASILTTQAVRSVDSNWGNSIFGSAP